MKKLTIHLLVVISLMFSALSCSESENPEKTDEEIREEFIQLFNEFYEVYGSSDADFVDYYAEDFINMDNTGETEIGSEGYKEEWEENFKTMKIDKLEYTQPEIVFSRDMIMTYNDYDESFVNTETGDTSEVKGTWIAVWKKIDSEWKVVMTTYHLKD